MLFSSRGIPDGVRHMDGFALHTLSLVNAAGERVWVKWHFKTKQGIKNLDSDVAERIAGQDPLSKSTLFSHCFRTVFALFFINRLRT